MRRLESRPTNARHAKYFCGRLIILAVLAIAVFILNEGGRLANGIERLRWPAGKGKTALLPLSGDVLNRARRRQAQLPVEAGLAREPMVSPTPSCTPTPSTQAILAPVPILLSALRPATSDVRGNLGPASVVTSEVMDDWLADRWQAALNMGGDPIPGEHWVEVDLGLPATISRVLLDWEDAYSTDWTLEGTAAPEPKERVWRVIAQGAGFPLINRTKWHALQDVRVGKGTSTGPFSVVRLRIHSPSTRWGSSLWRFQVWGQRL